MRKCSFWAAAAGAAGGLVVMAIMGRNAADAVHTVHVLLAAILASVLLATWLIVDRLDRNFEQARAAERRRTERDVDDELLVARTIKATLTAVGHDLDRPDAKVYQLNK